MRARTAVMLVLMLIAKSATASQEIDLQAIVEMFEERDLARIQSTRSQAYEALSLEHRNRAAVVAANAYWGRMVEDAKRHDQVSAWWRDWWNANKNKHAVFDREVEERVRILVLDLAETIESELKPMHRQLPKFLVPEQVRLHSRPSPLFDVEFNPWFSASASSEGLHRDNWPWLYISCEFQTSDLAEPPDWQRRDERLPPQHLRDHVTKAFNCQLDGTDIAIKVKAAAKDVELVKSIQRVLKKHVDTQPGAPCHEG